MKRDEHRLKVTLVMPTIREDSLLRWMEEWREYLESRKEFIISLILVEDNPEPTFKIPSLEISSLTHYSWEDIDRELGEISWIIPRHSDCVRSYGFYKAWKEGADIIISIDDDCYPLRGERGGCDFLETHVKKLTQPVEVEEEAWVSTLQGVKPRGLPYFERKIKRVYKRVVLNHGLWSNVPDLDAPTSLTRSRTEDKEICSPDMVVPRGKYFPMCGMNLAWRREVTPLMYFLLMGEDVKGNFWGFDRFGDIWAGIFSKKILDYLGFQVSSGKPWVYHHKQSNVFANLKKEAPGIEVNEILWKRVEEIRLTGKDFLDCYRELASTLRMEGEYWERLKKAMLRWVELFE